ncbi:MAG: PorV/PorQ family protein [Candidatus Latescibacterota bacterium]|nr:MAG: PorV/PorQ family protein [Candidatus Latescibacterota bacterium]
MPQTALLAAATLIAAASPLRGAEDAGTRSVFAFGAGNRALSMGAAYVAVADDPSAPLWNPAGLGWVPRRAFDLSYASLYGLDMSEQYAGVALPSWRFGTVGLTFQQFSAGRIDIRDDRNFLIGENESDSQTQFGLAYGRSFGPAWSLGATFKLRRHSLVGYSDTGAGLDTGVLLRPGLLAGSGAPWAHRLTFGLTVQNAVEPTIRLDQVGVPDPATVRAGIAYWLPVAGHHSALVAFDLEKTSAVDVRPHFGVEARIHSLLSVRAGFNHDFVTAGTGIRWRDLSVDYVFESNAIHDVHRFGASFRFGMTVEESRMAAREAEEEALALRLREEFAKRQAEHVDDLLRRAETECKQQRFDSALEILATIEVLAPDHPRTERLQADCLFAKARHLEASGAFGDAALTYGRVVVLSPGHQAATSGQERCRRLSDRRAARTEAIRQEYAGAVDAFTAEDFLQARIGFERVLELNPTDREAREMLGRTEQAIERRTESHLQLATRLIQDGILDEAEGLISRARKLDPQARGVADAEAQLRRARAAAARAATAQADPDVAGASPDPETSAAKTAAASPERQKEMDDLYQRGVAALRDGRAQDAIKYWELVWSFDPEYERVRDHLNREYVTQGMERFAQGDLTGAIQDWEKALRVDPSDERALAYITRAQEQLARTRQILGEGD